MLSLRTLSKLVVVNQRILLLVRSKLCQLGNAPMSKLEGLLVMVSETFCYCR